MGSHAWSRWVQWDCFSVRAMLGACQTASLEKEPYNVWIMCFVRGFGSTR